jgi:hypothetical protein
MHFSVESVTSKLQVLRAAQAIAETGATLCVREEEAPIFSYLSERLPLDWTIGQAPTIPVVIDHETPRTSVGDVNRPLLFPLAAVDRCRASWTHRDWRFTFAGLLTPARQSTLSDWSLRSGGKSLRKPSVLTRRFRPGAPMRGLPRSATVWDSDRGRTYPVKAWDDEYFHVLGRSQFVLCPSGDFTWTYRVFEAALCGGIPVAETSCEVYGDIRLRSLDEPASSLVWDAELAEHNQQAATRLVTAPREDLRAALVSLLG